MRIDAHTENLLKQYKERLPLLKQIEEKAFLLLSESFQQQGLYVTAIEHRVKTEESLIGKLKLKGYKYRTIEEVTDLVGLRVITFYNDDVDKIAALAKNLFEVDWQNSVDKRKLHQLTSFGYNSLHFICKLKEADADDPAMRNIRFELQMRTALQHVWSTIEHDTGYKGVVRIPDIYRRQFSRLAGMLELIDDEFSRLRIKLGEYRRQMTGLVKSGKLEEVPFSGDTFMQYLELRPFDSLNKRIAAVNQAEIIPAPLMPYYSILESFKLATLQDLDQFIKDNSEDAYQLAISQIAFTDLDILSENIGAVYDHLNGTYDSNLTLAEMMVRQAKSLPFMQDKD